ncbi:MAG: Uma2 family endonuclease [Acidobacteria bacterium]|nr:Uma2 family endonuclease [Acidobacteriota bacterium]
MAKGCQLLPANIRIKAPSMPPYRYGDLSELCGQAQFEKVGGMDALTNPWLIIKVLSDSTETYDRGDKFTHYKSIPAFSEYLLIAQHRPHISQFIKQSDASWIYREFNSLSDKVTLETMGCELSLSQIYQNITFDAPHKPIGIVQPA